MKLALPTDLEILEALVDGKRNTAANLSYELEKDRSYINTRLPVLADYGLLERIGPAPNSGLYEITEKGMVVAEHGDKYEHGDVDFDSFVEDRLDGRNET
ncbi:Transcriptional regulator, MarR family [Halanaeroarchaeum sp. HSR-CO]|uniref:winged helix-turn-helix domain-containing protein n=1 Tax=Halanaeroarchaeum sp. HSR-CO TaxID=2866382 RepID=UPI00217D930B|nr:winged helix-turn-helix domain-containing protein [Halanaeroarchaeum sp. HSR-CO]UWG48551.1 Transcriptional regulator, MarR family [Halanaeroarchaeum sp. HSR-CO]